MPSWPRRLFPAAAILVAIAGPALALDLTPAEIEQLRRLVSEHPRVDAAKSDVSAAQAATLAAKGRWYPEVTVGVSGAYSLRDNTNGFQNNHSVPRQAGLTVTQPLLDFGRIGSGVDRAKLTQEKTETGLFGTREDLLLEGLAARINLYKATRTVEFAQRSVDNIRKQSGMEQSRVDIGGGLKTDVLQTKSQLAGAEARLVRARSLLATARNRFKAVFAEEPPEGAKLTRIVVPPATLPPSLADALLVARKDNAAVRTATLATGIARADVRGAEAELYPRVNIVGEVRRQQNIIDQPNTRGEDRIGFELSYSLNSGLSAYHTIDAAKSGVRAADRRLDDTVSAVEEQIGNGWDAYAAARETAAYLGNQARIAEQFLGLAQEERALGRRSLIDVLTGETALINAQSDAEAAEADIATAAFSLLRSMGKLQAVVLQQASR